MNVMIFVAKILQLTVDRVRPILRFHPYANLSMSPSFRNASLPCRGV